MTVELVIFDFDGTLAHRPGMWSQCLLDVLDKQRPGHGVTIDELRTQLHDGFPWHDSQTPHTDIRTAEHWWQMLGGLLDRVYLTLGAGHIELATLRAGVRSHYCDPSQFQLYPDIIGALHMLRVAGLRVAILSNHVPELTAITTQLGLDGFVDDVFTSALIGYEKPHAEAFRIACKSTQPNKAWMIGDNPIADKRGAERAGMNAALVRHPDAEHHDVLSAVHAILG